MIRDEHACCLGESIGMRADECGSNHHPWMLTRVATDVLGFHLGLFRQVVALTELTHGRRKARTNKRSKLIKTLVNKLLTDTLARVVSMSLAASKAD